MRGLDGLCEEERGTYSETMVFNNTEVSREDIRDPVIVNVGNEDIKLDENYWVQSFVNM